MVFDADVNFLAVLLAGIAAQPLGAFVVLALRARGGVDAPARLHDGRR